MGLDFSKHLSGNIEKFVQAALPYSHWGHTYFNIRLMELVLVDSLLGDPIASGGDRFLDFGCGIGLAATYASRSFKKVDGVDINETGVAFNIDKPAPVVGQEIIERLGIDNVQLSVGDTFQFLEERPNTYDMILSVFVLEHVKDIESAAALLAKAMRVGGRAVHVIPNTHDTTNQLLIQNLQPTEHNERDFITQGRGLRKLGNLYAPITHSEFIEDYREQFEVNCLERFIFPMIATGLRVKAISPMREHSYAVLVEKTREE